MTHCRDMAVQSFPKCEVGRSVGRSAGRLVGRRSSILHCSHILLYATLGTQRARSKKQQKNRKNKKDITFFVSPVKFCYWHIRGFALTATKYRSGGQGFCRFFAASQFCNFGMQKFHCILIGIFPVLVRECSAIATLIVSQRVWLWVCCSVCPHFQNASSPAVLVGIIS